MKCEWTTKKISEIANFSTGKLNSNAAVDNGKYPFFTCAPEPLKIDTYNFDEKAIILAGNNAEGNFHISFYEGKFNAYQRTYIITSKRENVVDTKYLYYALKLCLAEFKAISQGTTTKFLTARILSNFEIILPAIYIQNKIAAILSALDEKIATNRAINDNLQQQAMALYAEMFLNSSDNDVTAGTLSDIAVITMGQSPSGSSYNEDGVGEIFYQGRAEFGFRFPKRRLFTTEPKRMAETGDVLLSVRAPVGDLNVAYERCCIGRGLGAIHSKTGHSSFVLYTMFALRSQLDVFNGEGTVFGSINRDALNAIPIDIPPVTEIDRFEAVAHPIDELIRANYEENCRLEAIRDFLLPKLMSGEIDVSAVQF